MKWIIWIALLMVSVGSVSASEPISKIELTSEEWEGDTNPDGTGLYWDLIRSIYEPVGIEVNFKIVPYERSIHLVKQQKADAWVGSYRDEEEFALYPQWHFDADVVTAIFMQDRFPNWAGETSLKEKNVGWIRGYSYDEYLETPVKKHELNNRKSGLSMVSMGRLDAFLDAEADLKDALKKPEIQKNIGDTNKIRMEKVMQLNLYLGFADSDRGRQLMQIWDDRFPELLKTGVIRKLYTKWNNPIWVFDEY